MGGGRFKPTPPLPLKTRSFNTPSKLRLNNSLFKLGFHIKFLHQIFLMRTITNISPSINDRYIYRELFFMVFSSFHVANFMPLRWSQGIFLKVHESYWNSLFDNEIHRIFSVLYVQEVLTHFNKVSYYIKYVKTS